MRRRFLEGWSRVISIVCGIEGILVVGAESSSALAADARWIARGTQGVVAADSEFASQAGLEMLKTGGNAIDAATAVSFALAVTRPYSTGLGGGGFLIARFADGQVVVQDFRETAPAAATADLFVRAAKEKPDRLKPSEIGFLAVAVPGLVAGRCELLAQHGTMPLGRVMEPAIRLAKSGYPVDEDYVRVTKELLREFEAHASMQDAYRYVYRTHLGAGRPRAVGDLLVQPELGRLLEEITRNGPEFFYRGPVAECIAREMQRHGGIITAQDLADYRPKSRQPLLSSYRDYQLITMPSPSSGGIALAEALNILETLDLGLVAKRDAVLATHYQLEAMKHAFADRARWLGDQDFVSVPIERLISDSYAASLTKRISPDRTAKIESYGLPTLPDDSGTSHFCVADRFGNVVASTETINTAFGSLAAIDEWGLILNNEMDDFTAEEGSANAFGLVQSSRNAITPGKRPLSSMCPTIVLKNDQPHLLLGASGGPRIISSVLNVLLGVTDFDLSLEEAMQRPRPHHQWQPDQAFFDREPSGEVSEGLKRRGHLVTDERRTGIVQAILRAEGEWVGASDPRKGGIPAGY